MPREDVNLVQPVCIFPGQRIAVVTFDPDWEEFVVHLWEGDRWNDNASYSTTDKQDALDTAKAMVR